MNVSQLLSKVLPAQLRQALPHKWQRAVKKMLQRHQYWSWLRAGRPAPPPHLIKVRMIRALARHYNLSTFIETGTYMGDMIAEIKDEFEQVYSIELSETLHLRAQRIFKSQSYIKLIQGDSATELRQLLKQITSPALIWLDAHYSGAGTAKADSDTPVLTELAAIFAHQLKHLVLIDDARLFGVDPAYPTLSQVHKIAAKNGYHYCGVYNDSILITPHTH